MTPNRRILVVDDTEAAVDAYRSYLMPDTGALTDLLALTGEAPVTQNFDVVFARQGEEGYEQLKAANAAGRPFAAAFLDLRMPPGWDGIETAEAIRKIDSSIYLVIVTAFADHTLENAIGRLTHLNLLLQRKPISQFEIYNLARLLVETWNKDRVIESLSKES